ncbi:MAG: hypothetical protein ACSLEN_08735 [Candidatus Malihini olakiniferum]
MVRSNRQVMKRYQLIKHGKVLAEERAVPFIGHRIGAGSVKVIRRCYTR